VSSTTSRTRRLARARAAGWAASTAALLLGALAGIAGWTVQATPEDTTPVPLPVGTAWVVPERVPFAGDLVVYGTPPGGERPDLAGLGCQVTDGGGPLSTVAARQEDRIVVDGRGLVPLVSFPGREGYGLACSGQAAVAAAPLYVVPAAGSRDLVPLATWSVAALLVPVGAVGLLMLRASRD
jgi:hypothetical protein